MKRSFDSRSAYSLGSAVNDATLDAGSHDRTAPSKAQTFAVGQAPMAVATELLPSWPGLSRPSTQRRLNDEADITANGIRLTEQGSPAVPLGSWSCVAPNGVDGRVKPGHDVVFADAVPPANSRAIGPYS